VENRKTRLARIVFPHPLSGGKLEHKMEVCGKNQEISLYFRYLKTSFAMAVCGWFSVMLGLTGLIPIPA
jgi:hypothetical protein